MNRTIKNVIIFFIAFVVVFLFVICVYFFIHDSGSNILLINAEREIVSSEQNDSSSNEVIVSDYNEDNKYDENDVVNYFENMEYELENSSSFKENFITVVDFIFYDSEIKGYTFDELSGITKTKIIGIAIKMDSRIEEYAPNYKEIISSNSSINIKEKLVILYMDTATDICSNNEEKCLKVKENFGEIRDDCSIGWEFIKGLLSDGVSKLKGWYEIYSGK